MKELPVEMNEQLVGFLSLTENTISTLEEGMKIKFKTLDSEPFTVSFEFKVDAENQKMILARMLIEEKT